MLPRGVQILGHAGTLAQPGGLGRDPGFRWSWQRKWQYCFGSIAHFQHVDGLGNFRQCDTHAAGAVAHIFVCAGLAPTVELSGK